VDTASGHLLVLVLTPRAACFAIPQSIACLGLSGPSNALNLPMIIVELVMHAVLACMAAPERFIVQGVTAVIVVRGPTPGAMAALCEAAWRRRVLDVLVIELIELFELFELVRVPSATRDQRIIIEVVSASVARRLGLDTTPRLRRFGLELLLAIELVLIGLVVVEYVEVLDDTGGAAVRHSAGTAAPGAAAWRLTFELGILVIENFVIALVGYLEFIRAGPSTRHSLAARAQSTTAQSFILDAFVLGHIELLVLGRPDGLPLLPSRIVAIRAAAALHARRLVAHVAHVQGLLGGQHLARGLAVVLVHDPGFLGRADVERQRRIRIAGDRVYVGEVGGELAMDLVPAAARLEADTLVRVLLEDQALLGIVGLEPNQHTRFNDALVLRASGCARHELPGTFMALAMASSIPSFLSKWSVASRGAGVVCPRHRIALRPRILRTTVFEHMDGACHHRPGSHLLRCRARYLGCYASGTTAATLKLIIPAAARAACIHDVLVRAVPFAARVPDVVVCGTAYTSTPGPAGFLELGTMIHVLARASPERAHSALGRLVVLIGKHARVLALVGHDAVPECWLDVAVGAAARGHRTAGGRIAIDGLGGQAARAVPIPAPHLTRDRRGQRHEPRLQRAVTRLDFLERDRAAHLLTRVGLALDEGFEPHHGVEVARIVRADSAVRQGVTKRAQVGVHDLDGFGRGDRTRLGELVDELLLEAHLRTVPILLPACHALMLLRIAADQRTGHAKPTPELANRWVPQVFAPGLLIAHHLSEDEELIDVWPGDDHAISVPRTAGLALRGCSLLRSHGLGGAPACSRARRPAPGAAPAIVVHAGGFRMLLCIAELLASKQLNFC
jgi:hypothetical protein